MAEDGKTRFREMLEELVYENPFLFPVKKDGFGETLDVLTAIENGNHSEYLTMEMIPVSHNHWYAVALIDWIHDELKSESTNEYFIATLMDVLWGIIDANKEAQEELRKGGLLP